MAGHDTTFKSFVHIVNTHLLRTTNHHAKKSYFIKTSQAFLLWVVSSYLDVTNYLKKKRKASLQVATESVRRNGRWQPPYNQINTAKDVCRT